MAVRPRERGIALITAVLVAALATIAATALLAQAHSALRRSSNLFESETAWWYAEGMSRWGLSILLRDAQQTQIDSLGEIWAQPVPALPVDQGMLSGGIEDLNGRFNLNLLGLPDPQRTPYLQQFARLAECAGIDAFEAEQLTNAIADWVDADQQTRFPGGAEELDYLGLQPPYRIADRAINSLSELAAVKGMSREHYEILRPHLAALPVDPAKPTPINPNTATEAVLCSIPANGRPGPGLQDFIANRDQAPLQSTQEAVSQNLFGAGFDPDTITVNSEYFLIQAQAFIGTGRVALYSVVQRRSGSAPTTLSRRVDTD